MWHNKNKIKLKYLFLVYYTFFFFLLFEDTTMDNNKHKCDYVRVCFYMKSGIAFLKLSMLCRSCWYVMMLYITDKNCTFSKIIKWSLHLYSKVLVMILFYKHIQKHTYTRIIILGNECYYSHKIVHAIKFFIYFIFYIFFLQKQM